MTSYALLKVKCYSESNSLLFNIINSDYFMNSEILIGEENIATKDGQRSKKYY